MESLIVERDGGIVTVTLNRPEKKNAVTTEMWRAMADTFTEIGRSTEDRVVVVTGAGDAFCSGADLTDPSVFETHGLVRMRWIDQAAAALHRLPKPVIAKVNGVAAGAGCNLALGCDLIVASDRARFSEIFSARGLSVDFGGTWLLPRLVGLHKAKELAFFAEVISADEAERFGLVNRIVPADELDAFVDDWARRLAAGPPLALSSTKLMLNNATSPSFEQALDAEAATQALNFTCEDAGEAVRAFLEKRSPEFRGR